MLQVKKNNFYFIVSINDDDFNFITIPKGSYEFESLNDEIKRINIKEVCFTEKNYHFEIKPNFSTLGSITENKSKFIGSGISFLPDDSMRSLSGFDAVRLSEKYNLSPKPVDILSFNNIFLEKNIAQGMVFKGKRFRNNS